MASSASSPGRTIRPLLRQAFSRRRLIKSSYAGQKRRRGGIDIVKPGLKKYQKMADIHGMFWVIDLLFSFCFYSCPWLVFFSPLLAFVLKKYPHISQAAFGAIVNSFLGEGPNTIHQMEASAHLHSCLKLVIQFVSLMVFLLSVSVRWRKRFRKRRWFVMICDSWYLVQMQFKSSLNLVQINWR